MRLGLNSALKLNTGSQLGKKLGKFRLTDWSIKNPNKIRLPGIGSY